MNDGLQTRPSNLQKLIHEVEDELEGLNHTPFSEKAFERLKSKISEYSLQLINESLKTSKRRKSDLISTSDVEHSSQYLTYSSGSKLSRNIGTLGGILLGAGLSTFLSMLVAGAFTANPVLIALSLTVIGMFMVAYQIAKE
ncbi:MAG TPA: hypothetical protein VF604_02090 [Pyrinomonadaceae bacterium]|jgi:vacuolar-type H+-ATPase subunit E/Vma4